ncbi:ABC-type tungstate transport system permease component [Methanonatronarchaeum thermophilum]|uniref:ABC-type tungstate transport system permease component n=1 Tax=Methanonatronarchaeum thermophilum TaxID=1927129 RepID=A0A1Y3GAB0_9EURY|nr:substrate-binding domain-containing protein [Methanonatronarchaeum thermophilum]OUJ18197.1 ABC-type tungstate transport system permease component [Methanonatronarchaeum thermophilum]
MKRRDFLKLIGGAAVGATTVGVAGCLDFNGDTGELPLIADKKLTLTTTTSTYDTGLLDALNGAFEERYGVSVEAVAQGTGAALETARRGDSDVVMVHARELEDGFLEDGKGVNRRDIMFNDFIIVGPEDDPAGIQGMEDAPDALDKIAETESTFVSRGDNSGTHVKELDIWDLAENEPGGGWYREAGDGMGPVLNQADGSDAYALADRGTFISMKANLDLHIMVEGPIEDGPEILANPYGIMAVNPGVHDDVKYDIAMAYIGFITSKEGQQIIEDYTVEGEQLFYPEAISDKPNFQQYVPKEWRK